MKKFFVVLALIGILTTSAFAKQHVESRNINRFFDLGFITATSDADKVVKVIQKEYLDKGFYVNSFSYDYDQGILIVVYDDGK